jgi:hypothetical protein
MKRIILGFLLLAGLAFACEKEATALLDEPPDLEQQKRALAQGFVGLLELSHDLNADDLAKLKTLHDSEEATFSNTFYRSSKGLRDLDQAINNINVHIRTLRQHLDPAAMTAFMDNGWRVYLHNGVVPSTDDCEMIFYNSVDWSNTAYESCQYYDRPRCFLNYERSLSMALYDYQICVGG